jgi:hypothetical protein
MVHTIGRTAVAQVQSLLRGFLQEGSGPFSAVLTVKDMIDLICQECVETADRIFTPVVTLWTFVSQVYSDGPFVPGGSRTSQRHVCRPRPRAVFAAHRRVLQSTPTPTRDAAVPPGAPEWSTAPATDPQSLALAWKGGQDRGRLGSLHAGHGGQPAEVSPA